MPWWPKTKINPSFFNTYVLGVTKKLTILQPAKTYKCFFTHYDLFQYGIKMFSHYRVFCTLLYKDINFRGLMVWNRKKRCTPQSQNFHMPFPNLCKFYIFRLHVIINVPPSSLVPIRSFAIRLLYCTVYFKIVKEGGGPYGSKLSHTFAYLKQVLPWIPCLCTVRKK